MEASTNIKKMLSHKISVPTYQRAFSWELEKQVSVFLKDLEEQLDSNSESKYYFGHFLFENNGDETYNIIDGQQRATTIIICLSALFDRIKQLDSLTQQEDELYEDIIIRKSNIKFSTVAYDNQDFIDYIIKQEKTASEKSKLETNSATRFVTTFHYFKTEFTKKDKEYLRKLLDCITLATCTTHEVNVPAEAIQMFIFQNDRGKKPTNLEVLKSKFMFHIHLKATKDESEFKLNEITKRFENIYRNISHFDNQLEEDSVLQYAYRFYKNSLSVDFSMEEMDKRLQTEDCLDFITKFTLILENSFDSIKKLFAEEKEIFEIHSLTTLGNIGIAYSFIIKLYIYNSSIEDKKALLTALECILIRHRLISSRAKLVDRLNYVYQEWTESNNTVQPIIDRIEYLKTAKDWWWAYWNTSNLEQSINGKFPHPVARFILWKYENYLNSSAKGYKPIRYTQIEKPSLEHIAPKKSKDDVASGYCDYDDEFTQEYLDCLGNYLLLSNPHNSSIGNISFSKKCATYNNLQQQRDVKSVHENGDIWDKTAIDNRLEKIKDFILENL